MKPNKTQLSPFSVLLWDSASWVCHGLSFVCLTLFILFAFCWPLARVAIDLLLGVGASRDAQGGAFGLLWLLLGSYGGAVFFLVVGSGVVGGPKSPQHKKLQYSNLIAVLSGFVCVLFFFIIYNR